MHNSVDFLICHFTFFCCFPFISVLLWWRGKHLGIENLSDLDGRRLNLLNTNWLWRKEKFLRKVTFSVIELLCSSALRARSTSGQLKSREHDEGQKSSENSHYMSWTRYGKGGGDWEISCNILCLFLFIGKFCIPEQSLLSLMNATAFTLDVVVVAALHSDVRAQERRATWQNGTKVNFFSSSSLNNVF